MCGLYCFGDIDRSLKLLEDVWGTVRGPIGFRPGVRYGPLWIFVPVTINATRTLIIGKYLPNPTMDIVVGDLSLPHIMGEHTQAQTIARSM